MPLSSSYLLTSYLLPNNIKYLYIYIFQIEKISTEDNNVFLIAACNKPWLIDGPIASRFRLKIHVPLPNNALKAQFISSIFDEKHIPYKDSDILMFLNELEGYSLRELSTIIDDALINGPITNMRKADHFIIRNLENEQKLEPCFCTDLIKCGGKAIDYSKIPLSMIIWSPVTLKDIKMAKLKTKINNDEFLIRNNYNFEQGITINEDHNEQQETHKSIYFGVSAPLCNCYS